MIKTETVSTNTGKYALAGWLAIASAIMIVPQVILALIFEYLFGQHPVWKLAVGVMSVAGLLIGVYVLYMFRVLLNTRFSFHEVDGIITTVIMINIVLSIGGLLGLMPGMEVIAAIASLVVLVGYGIISIVFGVKMLKLQDDLFGLLKPYAYVNIASGVCAATVILAPFGLLLGVAALVIQGIVFLKAGDDTEYL